MKILLSILFSLIFTFVTFGQQSDDATVYFYRIRRGYSIDYRLIKNIRIYINDEIAFKIPQKYFIAVKLPPGDYNFKIVKNQPGMQFSVEPKKTYFIQAIQTLSEDYFTEMLMEERDQEQARSQLTALKALPGSKLRNKKLVFVKEK